MGFLYPYFLLLGFGIIIPIVIHLFNFHRFKQVLFTNVKFLQSIIIQNKKHNKLLESLLLLMRCLCILLLALLFSQPYIKNSEKQLVNSSSNAVVIVLDNSFSMQNTALVDNLLSYSKSKIKQIIDQYSDNDVFCLLTTDLQGYHKHFVYKQTFLNLLNDVTITPTFTPYSNLINTAHHLLSLRNETSKRMFVVGDFQRNSFDINNIKQDTNVLDVFLPLEVKNIDNIYVDSVWLDKNIFLKDKQINLTARINNSSSTKSEKLPVKLYINNKQQSLTVCDIEPYSYIDVPISFVIRDTGHIPAKINILDNPITYDDDFYFTINISKKINILSINNSNENKYLTRLFNNSDEVNLDNININNLDFSILNNYSVIILNELHQITSGLANELNNLRQKGISLVVIPNESIDIDSYSSAMQILHMPSFQHLNTQTLKVNRIDIDNHIFKNVFSDVTDNMPMPTVQKYYKLKASDNVSIQNIMTLTNDDALFVENSVNNSLAYIFTVPFNENYSDLVNQSIFVPLMWNIVLYSNVLPPLYMFSDDNSFVDISILTPNNKAEYISLNNPTNNISIIPQMQNNNGKYGFYLHNQIKYAGYYNIQNNDTIIGIMAINYPRKESDLKFFNSSEINKLLKQINYKNYNIFNDRKLIKTYFNQSVKGFDFTPLILVLILVCLTFEVILLRKLKH